MKTTLKLILLIGLPTLGFSQTMTTTGNWDNSSNWTSGDIGDLITENVTLNGNVDPTIRTGFNYTIGNLTTGNGNDLIIQSGASLTLGASGNAKNLTTNNNATLTIAGTLTIWGDLVVNNNITWNVTGSVIIKGRVNLGSNGAITIGGTGTVQVDGNFTGGNNTALTVNGNVSIGGNLSVGNGSTIAGTGTVTVAGTCADGTSTFCATGPLPISLLFFSPKLEVNKIIISWATASELNNDFFTIERAANIEKFEAIGNPIDGNGTTAEKNYYAAEDPTPLYGRSYYRLKQTDFDGAFTYSPVRVIDYEGPRFETLRIYPNPSQGYSLTIEVNGLKKQASVPVQIYDIKGQKIFERMLDVNTPGILKHDLEFGSPLKQGLYIIKAGQTLQLTQKLIVD
jgi:Secretion system C-terminal sorting domain